MFYLVKTPWWLKRIYDSYTWSMPAAEKNLFLTFDDGPHPIATPFVLKQLKQYNAMATFFCIGKNVERYPEIFKQITDEGHTIGNHTYNHLNGWKTHDELFLQDVLKASHVIDSSLFRPPYGRITSFQAKNLKPVMKGKEVNVVMWDVLSGDFDKKCTPENCLGNVVLSAVPGSIIVFHDSEKAFPNLEYALPRVLSYFLKKGYSFNSLL